MLCVCTISLLAVCQVSGLAQPPLLSCTYTRCLPPPQLCSHPHALSPPLKCFSFNLLTSFLAALLNLLTKRPLELVKTASTLCTQLNSCCHLLGYILTCCRRVISQSDFPPPPTSFLWHLLSTALHRCHGNLISRAVCHLSRRCSTHEPDAIVNI